MVPAQRSASPLQNVDFKVNETQWVFCTFPYGLRPLWPVLAAVLPHLWRHQRPTLRIRQFTHRDCLSMTSWSFAPPLQRRTGFSLDKKVTAHHRPRGPTLVCRGRRHVNSTMCGFSGVADA